MAARLDATSGKILFDINETLARHLATGGGAAYELRRLAQKDLPNAVAELFDARTDVRRLERAQQVARTILNVNDFADMMELRHIVAQQELRRLIHYAKQKDHTAHTTYLYLLGIWFFDHVTDVHDHVVKASGTATEEEACRWFLFQWLFASLLHDIGYAFYDLSKDTQIDRKRIDGIYSWDWLVRLLGPDQKPGNILGRRVKPESLAKLRSTHDRWTKQYGKKMPAPTSTYAPHAYEQVLTRLASAPWLGDLHPDWAGKDVLDVLNLGPDGTLRAYAEQVATKGYVPQATEGSIDHAVASGLLLFQYVSYWYWLMNELRPDADTYRDVSGGFNYTIGQLHDRTVPACQAVAYHNFQPSVTGASEVLKLITLEDYPVLYLAIVCDELQRWDRYPAGEAVLLNFEETAAAWPEGDDIELSCTGTDKKCARFCVAHPRQSSTVDDLKRTLAKLSGFDRIVSIAGHGED